jgi:hypothetical protein
VWTGLNAVSNALFGALLWPAPLLPSWLVGALLGALSAPLALIVFRYTSDQPGIERSRNRIQAHLLELRLFGDDLRLALRAQAYILRHNLAYLARAAVPALLLAGPFTLALVQLEARFAVRPLPVGAQAALRVELQAPARPSEQPAEIRVPRGLTLETPALRKDGAREIAWRVRADLPGRYLVTIRVGEQEYERRLMVGSGPVALARRVYASGDIATLLAPSERALPRDGPVRCIEVDYPMRSAALGLSDAAWWFVAGSLVLGFALRRPFGVHL